MTREPMVWMWTEACDLLDRAERLQRQFFRPGRSACWEPPVDLFETERELSFQIALPGVRADQVEIAVADGMLIVAGARRLAADPHALIHRLEIPHGRFERRLALPSGRYEVERRELADGLLILVLRKLV